MRFIPLSLFVVALVAMVFSEPMLGFVARNVPMALPYVGPTVVGLGLFSGLLLFFQLVSARVAASLLILLALAGLVVLVQGAGGEAKLIPGALMSTVDAKSEWFLASLLCAVVAVIGVLVLLMNPKVVLDKALQVGLADMKESVTLLSGRVQGMLQQMDRMHGRVDELYAASQVMGTVVKRQETLEGHVVRVGEETRTMVKSFDPMANLKGLVEQAKALPVLDPKVAANFMEIMDMVDNLENTALPGGLLADPRFAGWLTTLTANLKALEQAGTPPDVPRNVVEAWLRLTRDAQPTMDPLSTEDGRLDVLNMALIEWAEYMRANSNESWRMATLASILSEKCAGLVWADLPSLAYEHRVRIFQMRLTKLVHDRTGRNLDEGAQRVVLNWLGKAHGLDQIFKAS